MVLAPRLSGVARARRATRGLWFVAVAVGPFAYGLGGAETAIAALGMGLGLGFYLAWYLDSPDGTLLAVGAGLVCGLQAGFTLRTSAAVVHSGVPLALCVGRLDGFRKTTMSSIRSSVRTVGVVAVIVTAAGSRLHGATAMVGACAIFFGLTLWLATRGDLQASASVVRNVARRALLWVAAVMSPTLLWLALADEIAGPRDRVLTTAGVCAGYSLVFLGARRLARWLDPRLQFLPVLGNYLRVMAVPLGGFMIGYAIIVVVFAGLLASLGRLSPSAFVGMPDPAGFGDWFYLSLATATTLGYGDVSSSSGAAKLILGCEAVVATGWLVAVFGAVSAYIQPQLASLSGPNRSP